MGLFALEPVAVEGANLQLINHGLSSAGLFALVGMLYERFHTRSIQSLGGIATRHRGSLQFSWCSPFRASAFPD